MPARTKPKGKRVVRNRGLSDFARQEGVDISHAYRVVTGERESASLLARWVEFQRQRNSPPVA